MIILPRHRNSNIFIVFMLFVLYDMRRMMYGRHVFIRFLAHDPLCNNFLVLFSLSVTRHVICPVSVESSHIFVSFSIKQY
jgi:hypothetical protein